MVFALAGDSTMTRAVPPWAGPPLAGGVDFFLAIERNLREEEAVSPGGQFIR
jgi:hypothetical protein